MTEKILPCEGPEAPAQVTQRSWGCPIPGNVQSQVGQAGQVLVSLGIMSWRFLQGDWTNIIPGSLATGNCQARGPASSQVETGENSVYWAVWICQPGTSEPQK